MTLRNRVEETRALLDEAERVCRESEQVTRELERSMKRKTIWPERRWIEDPDHRGPAESGDRC